MFPSSEAYLNDFPPANTPQVPDVLNLLKTNNGDYAAACSLDFSKPPSFYDTFALRDSRGHEHASQTWPYFRSSKSRKAMMNAEPVRVSSCWNGIGMYPPLPYVPPFPPQTQTLTPHPLPLTAVAMPASTFTGILGLRFRGIPDSLAAHHLEASECCLIHADNPGSRTRGVFVNPAVRVGYNRAAYDAVHNAVSGGGGGGGGGDGDGDGDGGSGGGGSGGSWLSLTEVYLGLWRSRLARWFTSSWFEERSVRGRIGRWVRGGEGRVEKGGFCVIDEMQIVVQNGWKHL